MHVHAASRWLRTPRRSSGEDRVVHPLRADGAVLHLEEARARRWRPRRPWRSCSSGEGSAPGVAFRQGAGLSRWAGAKAGVRGDRRRSEGCAPRSGTAKATRARPRRARRARRPPPLRQGAWGSAVLWQWFSAAIPASAMRAKATAARSQGSVARFAAQARRSRPPARRRPRRRRPCAGPARGHARSTAPAGSVCRTSAHFRSRGDRSAMPPADRDRRPGAACQRPASSRTAGVCPESETVRTLRRTHVRGGDETPALRRLPASPRPSSIPPVATSNSMPCWKTAGLEPQKAVLRGVPDRHEIGHQPAFDGLRLQVEAALAVGRHHQLRHLLGVLEVPLPALDLGPEPADQDIAALRDGLSVAVMTPA
jgi:hypothetical protein